MRREVIAMGDDAKPAAEEATDDVSIVVEFEGVGVATMSARDLAHVLHHARRLAEAPAPEAPAD